MTEAEHNLMIGMFAKTIHTIQTLITLLESKGVIDKGDVGAYQALLVSDEEATHEMIRYARHFYLETGESLGALRISKP